MPGDRVFDLFNAKIGSTQLVGAESAQITQEFDRFVANNDGALGVAASDRGAFGARMTLRCQEISSWPAALQLFVSNDTNSIHAEGKLVGGSNAKKIEFKRAKLVSSNLSFREREYCACDFEFANSADAASDSPDDEVTITDIARTITHSTNKRGYRASASYSVGPLAPLSVMGLDIAVRGQLAQTVGDQEWGRISEVAGYDVTGTLTFKDETLSTGAAMAQRLLAAARGTLTITFLRSNGGTSQTLAIANLQFIRDVTTRQARQFGGQSLEFACQWTDASNNVYDFNGTNKMFTIT